MPRLIKFDKYSTVESKDSVKQPESQSDKLTSYLTESAKTLSGKFYYDSNLESEPDVYHYAQKAILACQNLDLVKKKKFYNKNVNISSSAPADIKFLKEDSGENSLHAAIGLTTECGEILEAIMQHKYEDKELDVVNIKEEIGDLMWYLAILLRDHNIDLFDAMETNINKLRARYGEKFSTEKAINRNLDVERTVLETKITPITGMTTGTFFKDFSTLADTKDERILENGGMAPPKEWKSITEIKLGSTEKNNLVEEMRKMRNNGETINTATHHKIPISIEEFTQPFKYIDVIHGYSGSFLVNLLKSELEIKTQSKILNLDLSEQLNKCANGDLLILSVFDISGSESKGENKKFFITLEFDKLNGTLFVKGVVSSNGKLSQRQYVELEKFCNSKKIIFNK